MRDRYGRGYFVEVKVTATAADRHFAGEGRRAIGRDWTAKSDASGVSRFDDIPSGTPLAVGLDTPFGFRWRVRDLVLAPGEHRVLQISSGACAIVRGRVLDGGGRPIADAAVTLIRSDPSHAESTLYMRDQFAIQIDPWVAGTVSGADGRFEVPAPAPGPAWIAASSARGESGQRTLRPMKAIEIPANRDFLDVDLCIDDARFATGHVVDLEGRGVVATIELDPPDRSQLLCTRGSADGSFEIGPLAAGVHRIRAVGAAGDTSSEWCEVAAGARDVELRLRRGASIQGSAVGPDGKPLRSFFEVEAWPASDAQVSSTCRRAWPMVDWQWLDDSAAEIPPPDYFVGGLAAGRYVLVATHIDGWIAISDPVQVTSETALEHFELALEQGARLDVSIKPHRLVTTVLVSAGSQVVGSADSSERVIERIVVPARELELRAVCRGEVVARATVTPRAGEMLKIELRGE